MHYALQQQTYITPWDIIAVLANRDGTSVFKAITIPSREIPTYFTVFGTRINNVYDLDFDEFMGTVAASRAIEDYEVTIYGVTTPISSFYTRLDQYITQQRRVYILETTLMAQDGGPLTYAFDRLNFLSGFMLPFAWIKEDHHRYWTNFYELVENRYETRTF